MTPVSRILLVGCGKMGGALLDGWREHFSNIKIVVVDPVSPQADATAARDVSGPFDCIVLAVKPQVMVETLGEIAPLLTPHTLVLSIAAGKTIAFYESRLGASQPIVRVMPNTPAAIGCGMSVLCSNAHVTFVQKQMASALMSAAGLAEWLDDENLMDAVTAVSGSGPAYIFHMIEALAAAGVAAGLSADLSMTLARQTVIGSGLLAQSMHDSDAATLRQNVTSPGGTTEAALKILMADGNGLTDLMTRAVAAATQRGKELAG